MGADNSAAFTRLQGAIDALHAVGELPEKVAADAVEPFRALLLGNIAAQRAPGGKAWPASKSGAPVLLGAGKALKVTSIGPVLHAELTGPEARHHLGAVKGAVRRQILPSRGSLSGVSKILKRLAVKRWRAAMSKAND